MFSLKKLLLVILVLAIVTIPLIAESAYMDGKLAGEKDANGSALWVLAGVGCGVFGILGAFLMKPAVPTDNLVGKDSDYIMGYTEGYQKKATKKNATFATVGCVAWSVVYMIIANG